MFEKVPKAVDFVSQSDVPGEHLPLIVATLTFLIAGFVKGGIGLGLPTVSMGLLSLVMAPAKAASLLIVPSFVTNVWQLAAGPSFGRLARRLWPMLAGGLATAATGVFAIPAAPYLGALNLDKENMIQALGLSFTVYTIALAAGGAFALGDIGASTAALAPALLGTAAGGALRGRFSEQTFRRVFFGGLLALGAHLASQAVM